MEYNKEWRSREKHSGRYTPYNRHKLKNWHTQEEADALDIQYNHRIRHRGGFEWRKGFDISLERKLIEKYVGKPFQEFEKVWYDRTKYLRAKGINTKIYWIKPQPQEPEDLSCYDKFYVDEYGIIRRNPHYKKRWWKSKEPIKILEKEVVKWYLHPDIFNYEYGFGYILRHSEIMRILQKYVSKEEFNQIIGGALDDIAYTKIRDRVIYTGLYQALYRYCKKYNAQFTGRQWKCKNWCNYDDFTSLFYKDTSESVYKYIKPDTPEFTKIKAEQQDAKRKEWRDLKKFKSERAESLIHDIEAKRKAEDQKTNDQKIQSHSFDKYESFRGEEYHGGHKKKNS